MCRSLWHQRHAKNALQRILGLCRALQTLELDHCSNLSDASFVSALEGGQLLHLQRLSLVRQWAQCA